MPEQDKDRLAGLDPRVGVAETIDTSVSAEEHRMAVAKEYGQYVATAAITHDGVRAYNIGDAVPAANVKRWRYDDAGLVARVGTMAGAQTQEVASGGEVTAPARKRASKPKGDVPNPPPVEPATADSPAEPATGS